MAEVYTYNATHLTKVREGTVELSQMAELGGIGGGRFVIDDTTGTQAIIGHKDFSVTQSSCSFTRTFRGTVGDRTYQRGEYAARVGAIRSVTVQVHDLNATLGFRLIDALDGKRPAETVARRGAWLMGSDYMAGLVADNGRCDFPDYDMDKSDYRHQFPGDVLADMAMASLGFNYHVNDWGSGAELTFRNDNISTADSSTLRISNVLSDASGVTYHPSMDATLERRSGFVYSKLALSYSKGTVIEERAATATSFNGERGGVASNSNIKTSDMASDEAAAMLAMHRTEEDVLTCTLTVPDTAVNLILPGQRIQAKFSHLNTEGYGSFTWMRVLERTIKPIVADGALYELRVKLSPQEGLPDDIAEPACTFDATDDGTYYPLGGPGSAGSSSSNLVGTNIAYYFRSGLAEPWEPNPTYQGFWHFPTYQAGGTGTTDYFASGFGNELRFIVVGNGTLTIQTERWASQAQPYTIDVYHVVNGTGVFLEQVTGIAGEVSEIEVTEANDPDCIHVIRLRCDDRENGVHIGMGWSQAEWDGSGSGGSGPPPGGGSGGSTGSPTFELATGSTLNPLVGPVYSSPGDPGFGLDSDFMANLSKVSVSGGVVTITATKVGAVWQSACFGTNGTFSQLYGEFEARIKYPNGQGVWPAFWMIAPGAPATPPEFDILEPYPGDNMLGTPGEDYISATLHSAGPVQTVQYDTGSDNTAEFHNYRLVWRAGSAKFYYDGVLILSTTTNVPSVAMYPILNLALGATGYRTDGTTPTTLTMEIAYMRVYA